MIELKIWKYLNIIWLPLLVIITTFDPRNFDDKLWGDIHFLLANFTTVVLFLLWWFPLWAIYKSRAKINKQIYGGVATVVCPVVGGSLMYFFFKKDLGNP